LLREGAAEASGLEELVIRIGIVLGVLLVVSLGACGDDDTNPVGEWRIDWDDATAKEFTAAVRRRPAAVLQASAMAGLQCGFADDGTCWAALGKTRGTGTWTQDGDRILIEVDGTRARGIDPEVTINDGVITATLKMGGKTLTWTFLRI